MLVDGKKISQEIKGQLKEKLHELDIQPKLVLVYAGNDSVIDKFIGAKQEFGNDVGVEVRIERFPDSVGSAQLREKITSIAADGSVTGIVVQLPLPDEINIDLILNTIPSDKDPDVLSEAAYKSFKEGSSSIIPPVTASVAEIFTRHNVELSGKKVVIVGRGRLVGKPTTDWLKQLGIKPLVLDENDELEPNMNDADIIISGAGDPHIIHPETIKDEVILIDAGTSDSAGGVKGDIHPDCADKAQVFSSVPGGIGPITVSKLFSNLIKLVE